MNQNFSALLFKHASLNLQKLFHNSSYNLASHYDTLNLQRNCTSKQIRDSFIKLSKENHPDINKSPDSHKQFLKIQEAYNVLSKPGTRASYDLSLSNYGSRVRYESTGSRARYGYGPRSDPRYTAPPYGRNPWDDPSFYHNRDRSQDDFNRQKPYYGIKGIGRQSNETILVIITFFTVTMFIVQMFAIRDIRHEIEKKRQMEEKKLIMLKMRNKNEMYARKKKDG